MDLCVCVSEEHGDNAGARSTLRSTVRSAEEKREPRKVTRRNTHVLLHFNYKSRLAYDRFEW
jgi:hypothetical protein